MSFQKAYAVTLTANTTSDIPAGRFVDLGANGYTLAGNNGDAVGVTLELFDASKFATDEESSAKPVAIEGIVEVESSGTIAVGANVATTATGTAKVAATGNLVVGRALTAAATGEFLSVLLIKRAAAAA